MGIDKNRAICKTKITYMETEKIQVQNKRKLLIKIKKNNKKKMLK